MKRLFLSFLFVLGLLGAAGCDRNDSLMERGGEKIDEAGKDIKRGVEDVTD